MSLKACVPELWMLLLTQNGVLSLLFLLSEVARCEIRLLRRLRHHRNAFGCQKLCSTAHPAFAVWDSWAPSWAQIFVIPNYSVSIKRTVSQFMFTSSVIILTVSLRSHRISSLTLAVLSPIRAADGRPLRCSSSIRVQPSENILCHRKACALDIASSPKDCWSFPCIVVALSPSLT